MYVNAQMSQRYMIPLVETFRKLRLIAESDVKALEQTYLVHNARFSTEMMRQALTTFMLHDSDTYGARTGKFIFDMRKSDG